MQDIEDFRLRMLGSAEKNCKCSPKQSPCLSHIFAYTIIDTIIDYNLPIEGFEIDWEKRTAIFKWDK